MDNPTDQTTMTPEQTFGSEPTSQGGMSGGDNGAPSQNTPQSQPTPTPAAAAPASNPITAEMIAEAVKAGVAGVVPALQPKAPPAPPTAEEIAQFDKQFNVVRVTADTYKQILGVAPQNAEQVKALENLLHGAAKQGVALSQYIMQQEMDRRFQQMQQQFNPAQQFVMQQQVQQTEQDFIANHPDLKDHTALCKEIAIAAKAQGQSFKSREEAFKFVADRARSLLGKAAPAGQPASPKGGQAQRRNMTPTSMGGSPGQGRPQQAGNGQTVSPKEVFGGTPE